jgi:hypothetical protein
MAAKASLIVPLLSAVLASLSFQAASAQVIPLTDRQLAAGSAHIVVAVVEGSGSRWNAERTFIVTDYALRIEERLKGEAPQRLVLTVPGGTVGDETHATSISTPLAAGARYLLFLERLDEPTLTPVLGAWQGVFRESAGPRGKRSFAALIRTARELIAEVEEHPQPADTAWLQRTEDPRLPAKTYNSGAVTWPPAPPEAAGNPAAGAKFAVRAPALAPIVFSTLLPETPFAGEDQRQLAYWNRYAGDVFHVSPEPSSSWAFGNGVFDIAGFPTSEQLQQQLHLSWGSTAFALVATRTQDGHIIEADLAFNPAVEWTLDDDEATRFGGPLSFKNTLLANLGKAWGYHGPIEIISPDGSFDETPISRDSALNVKAQPYHLATLFAEDAAAARATYGGRPIHDGAVSSYTIVAAPFAPVYQPVRPTPASVAAGSSVVLVGPIKIENVGTAAIVNPRVDLYLAPTRFSLDRAIVLRKVRIRGTVRSGEVRLLDLGRVTLPRSVPAGTYSFAFVLVDSGDEVPANNRAWSNADAQISVHPR